MKISVSYYSEIGGRAKNEDAVSLLESGDSVLALVADGLGGHSNGEIASALAVKTINGMIIQKSVSVKSLRDAIEQANELIWHEHGNSGMKSTIAAVWMEGSCAVAASVGDTRIYQFRNGSPVFQSRDHTVAQLSVMVGDLKPDQIRTSRERHKLTRALGGQDEVKIDMNPLDVETGDAFLLCSDGFWEKITEEEMIADLAASDSAAEWMTKMRGRVDARGAHKGDNHSAAAVVIK